MPLYFIIGDFMPASIVTSFAKKTGKSVAEVEKLWNEAKKSAKEQGRKETDPKFYNLVTGILKKMLKISEDRKLKTFIEFCINEAFSKEMKAELSAAKEEGRKAFKSGLISAPSMNKKFIDSLPNLNIKGRATNAQLMKAYIDGWTAENLK